MFLRKRAPPAPDGTFVCMNTYVCVLNAIPALTSVLLLMYIYINSPDFLIEPRPYFPQLNGSIELGYASEGLVLPGSTA